METKPSILTTAQEAYRDIYRMLQNMPWLFLIALLFCFAKSALDFMQLPADPKTPLQAADLAVGFLAGLLLDFFLVPFWIALYRFILLDEISLRYHFAPAHPRFLYFFAWTAVVDFLLFLPSVANLALPNTDVGSLFTVLLLASAYLFSLRFVLLFPQIAIADEKPNFASAYEATRALLPRIFATMTFAGFAPFLFFYVSLRNFMLVGASGEIGLPLLSASLMASVTNLLVTTLYVAVSARFFAATAKPQTAMRVQK